jgi:hypothetical protein
VRSVFAHLNLIVRPPPAAPSFIFNSAQDELSITKPVDELVAADCARGATIYYRTPPGDHLTGGSGLFGREAVAYIQDRFAGKPAPNTCPPRAAKAACRSRRAFTIRLPRAIARRARVRVGGRAVAVRRSSGRLVARVDLRGRTAQRVRLVVTGRTRAGRVVRQTRVYRTCAAT